MRTEKNIYRGRAKCDPSACVVKEAVVIGDVEIGEESSVLFHAVLRGDEAPIRIGKRSNIQDNCTVHTDAGCPAIVGDDVTVGHNTVLHGCRIGDGTLIGMGAVIMDNAKIGKECIIGAGSLVLAGQEIPDGSVVMGSPAKVKRHLTQEERLHNYENAKRYVTVGKQLRTEGYT